MDVFDDTFQLYKQFSGILNKDTIDIIFKLGTSEIITSLCTQRMEKLFLNFNMIPIKDVFFKNNRILMKYLNHYDVLALHKESYNKTGIYKLENGNYKMIKLLRSEPGDCYCDGYLFRKRCECKLY